MSGALKRISAMPWRVVRCSARRERFVETMGLTAAPECLSSRGVASWDSGICIAWEAAEDVGPFLFR